MLEMICRIQNVQFWLITTQQLILSDKKIICGGITIDIYKYWGIRIIFPNP